MGNGAAVVRSHRAGTPVHSPPSTFIIVFSASIVGFVQPVPGPPSPIVNSQHIIEPVLIRIVFPYEFELIVAFALGTFISVDFAGKRLQRLLYQVAAVLTFKNVKRHYSKINNFAGVAFLSKPKIQPGERISFFL